MSMTTLSSAAAMIGARLLGDDRGFEAVSTDSRKMVAGDLFVALRGEHFDGHEFVAQAKATGLLARWLQKMRPMRWPGSGCR